MSAFKLSVVLSVAAFLSLNRASAADADQDKAIEVAQNALVQAADSEKAKHLLQVQVALDKACSSILAGGNGADAIKKNLDAISDKAVPTLAVLEDQPGQWLIAYNIFVRADAVVSIVSAFSVKDSKARKVCSYGVDSKGQLQPFVLRVVRLQSVRDGTDPTKKVCVASCAGRTSVGFAAIAVDWAKETMSLVGKKEFDEPNGVDSEVRAEKDLIVVTNFRESGLITEADECMLQEELRFAVESGSLVSKGSVVLNPWYEAVLKAVRAQKDNNQEQYKEVCADRKLWDLMSDSLGLSCERQRKDSDTKATVVLNVAREPADREVDVTLQLTKGDNNKWMIEKMEESKPARQRSTVKPEAQ